MAIGMDTCRDAVYPWPCDSLGHITTQFYCGVFDAASFHMLSGFGPCAEIEPLDQGWADVKQTIEDKREARADALVPVTRVLIRTGNKSVEFRHSMLNSESGVLHATSENITVLFDLEACKGLPLSDAIRARCRELGAA
ncbi:MAG: acyl-CoA thioesterase [Hyphomicrobiaceae bacterium]